MSRALERLLGLYGSRSLGPGRRPLQRGKFTDSCFETLGGEADCERHRRWIGERSRPSGFLARFDLLRETGLGLGGQKGVGGHFLEIGEEGAFGWILGGGGSVAARVLASAGVGGIYVVALHNR